MQWSTPKASLPPQLTQLLAKHVDVSQSVLVTLIHVSSAILQHRTSSDTCKQFPSDENRYFSRIRTVLKSSSRWSTVAATIGLRDMRLISLPIHDQQGCDYSPQCLFCTVRCSSQNALQWTLASNHQFFLFCTICIYITFLLMYVLF
jgi:hypothetical protein